MFWCFETPGGKLNPIDVLRQQVRAEMAETVSAAR
jgi:hypothetical protein